MYVKVYINTSPEVIPSAYSISSIKEVFRCTFSLCNEKSERNRDYKGSYEKKVIKNTHFQIFTKIL